MSEKMPRDDRDLELNEQSIEDLESTAEDAERVKGGMPIGGFGVETLMNPDSHCEGC